MVSRALFVLVAVVVCAALVSAQSGNGGGTCYESRGRSFQCPTYKYTTVGPANDTYEHRTYDSTFYVIEDVNATVVPGNRTRPIEGIFETYRPLEEYFFQNNLTRDVAPGLIGWFEGPTPGEIGYAGAISLPIMTTYPTPANNTVQVSGGQAFDVYVKAFSHDRAPTNEEIVFASDRFLRQLTNDSIKLQNFTLAAFYEPVGTPGNNTKEIWFFPVSSTVPLASLQALIGAPVRSSAPVKSSKSRRFHK